MSEKKHIDRLFQEKFKDFEAQPNDMVWNAIQNQLNRPVPKSKESPFWLRLARVAALVLLLFTIGNAFFETDTIEGSTNSVATETTKNLLDTTNTDSTKNTVVSENNLLNSNSLNVKSSNNAATTEVTNATISTDDTTNSRNSKTTASTASKKESNSIYLTVSGTLENNKQTQPNTTVSEWNATNTSNINAVNKKRVTNSNSTSQNNASAQAKYTNTSGLNTRNVEHNESPQKPANRTQKNKLNAPFSDSAVSDKTSKAKENLTTYDILSADIKSHTSKEVITLTHKDQEEKINSHQKNEEDQTTNPLELAALENNEEPIEEEKEKKLMNRWTVNANISPVYYNTLGKGSHIDAQFIDNPKTGEINTSYGINVGYALNDRLKVRAGINKLNLSYDTAEVIVYENVSNTPNSSPLRNINFISPTNEQAISLISERNFNAPQIGLLVDLDANTALSQRLGYLEVPLEIVYTVINKRAGVHLIGGVSTLVLEDNALVTEVESRKTKIGEANNINNVSFTTNLGLGLDYKFSNTFKFNLEPTFKYQVNAYNETSGNFKPYIIGIYTGFSYKF